MISDDPSLIIMLRTHGSVLTDPGKVTGDRCAPTHHVDSSIPNLFLYVSWLSMLLGGYVHQDDAMVDPLGDTAVWYGTWERNDV